MISNNPMTDVGTLHATVGRGSSGAIQWVLEQVHFHWGRTGLTNEGSEHYVQVRMPLVLCQRWCLFLLLY